MTYLYSDILGTWIEQQKSALFQRDVELGADFDEDDHSQVA